MWFVPVDEVLGVEGGQEDMAEVAQDVARRVWNVAGHLRSMFDKLFFVSHWRSRCYELGFDPGKPLGRRFEGKAETMN
jgi:hypothetical protein